MSVCEELGFMPIPFERLGGKPVYICTDAQVSALITRIVDSTVQKSEDAKRKIVHFDLSSTSNLICNNPSCDHVDDGGGHTIHAGLIGKTCPKCGESLLTQADFDKTMRLYRRIASLNKWLGPIFGRTRANARAGKHAHFGLRFVGDRIITKSYVEEGLP